MKRKWMVSWAASLAVAWLAAGPAYGWILAQDQEQVQAVDQNGLEIILEGHVIATGGGKSAGTNPFSSPNRVSFLPTGGGSPTTGITKTGVRFFGFDASTIPNSAGVKRHVAVFADGPNVPGLLDKYWTPDGTQANSPTARSPGVSFSFEHLGNGQVEVTVRNALTADAIRISEVGYRVLAINSFTTENLNRTHMPPGSFTASGVGDGTVLAASGGSATYVVNGVTLHDDLVVYATAEFDTLGGPASGNWAAWNSGTYLPARKPFLGRVPIRAVPPAILVGETVASVDVALRTPFQVVTQVAGDEPARFLSIRRIDYDPGRCVPNGDDPTPGVGCIGAFGNAVLLNANLNDLLLDTTGSGGTKISYLRTAGVSVYTDVRVRARIMPGASTTTTTVAGSDDFGGPVAVRIGPTGGSYFASVVTAPAEKNRITLKMDSVDGSTQTVLASATQWDNQDPINLDHNVPDPLPETDTPAPYTPTVYDVVLTAVGSSLTLTVTEVGNPDHTVTLGPVVDSTYPEGYVGLRTQRDGGPISSDPDSSIATLFETVVRDYTIEDPTATPIGKAAMIMEYDTQPGDPGERGGSLGSSRAIEVINDHAIAELLLEAGFEVDEIKMAYELDYWTRDGEFIFSPDATIFHPTPLNDYDLVWYSGTGADQSRNAIGVYLTKPIIMGEHVGASGRNCLGTPGGIIPGQPGDTCPAGQSDSRMGLWDSGSGDFRPDANQTGPHASALRILAAAGDPSGKDGDPNHPIVAGLSDGSGTQEIPVYAEPWPHMQSGGTNFGAGVQALAGERVAGGPDGDVNGHGAWGLVVADPGDGRQILGGDGVPNTTFAARSAFVFVGDHMAHRLSPQGREIARRTALWAAGLPIPPSPFLYFGDFDEDGDVDAVDYGHMLACLSGTNPVDFESLCADADSDGDGDADRDDLNAFTVCFNGSGNLPPTECVTPRISIRGEPIEGVPNIPFDFDDDADVDATDLAVFAACANGPEVAHNAGEDCDESDADLDGDIDSTDFAAFQRCYSGENNPSRPDCADVSLPM